MINDPELHELFDDPADREVVELLRAARPAAPPLDPHFRNYLRAKLMTEARQTLPEHVRRTWFRLGPIGLAPAMAAVAAGFIVVLGVEIYLQNQPSSQQVAADLTQINHKTSVATGAPIQIPFSGPVDKNAVAESVVVEPATAVTKQWVGQTLVIIPNHPLAPNTTYTVTLKPKATASPNRPTVQPTAAPTSVVVHFTTVQAPPPRVVPPSFQSANVSYGHDDRLQNPGSILSATWTPDGQLLVTRPAGQGGPGSVPSPSTTSTASGPPVPKATTDVWLMTSDGKFVRELSPGGGFPSAAPSGGLFADWRQVTANQSTLEVRDFTGALQAAAVATIAAVPDRPAVWLGASRLGYLSGGVLQVVDLQGNPVSIATLEVDGALATSADGLLAAQTPSGPVVDDLQSLPRPLAPAGAAGFAWSSKDDLAFVVQQPSATQLYVAPGGRNSQLVATSPDGQTWSDLNWAPDATSLLFATRAGSSITASRLTLINADGSARKAFAGPKEYAGPVWSPQGDFVLFTRTDEAGGRAFWTATTSPSSVNSAEDQVIAEVDKFMQARIQSDSTSAQTELDAAGVLAYQSGASTLLAPAGSAFDRYYPVSVQHAGSNFLVMARIFMTKAGQDTETSFFEEQLTVRQQGQGYRIDGVTASATMLLGHGPTVVSVNVVPDPPGERVQVRFDADLKPETVTADTIQIKDANGQVVAAHVTFDPDDHLVTLAVKLRQGNYTLVISTAITDINSVAIAAEYDAPLVISR